MRGGEVTRTAPHRTAPLRIALMAAQPAPQYTKVVAKTANGTVAADHSPLINPLIGSGGGYAIVATLGEWPTFELACFSRKIPSFGFFSSNPGEGISPLMTAKLLAKILGRHKDYRAKVRQLEDGSVFLVVGRYSQQGGFTAIFHSFPLAPAPAAVLVTANMAFVLGCERRRVIHEIEKQQRRKAMAALAQMLRASGGDGDAEDKNAGNRETNNK